MLVARGNNLFYYTMESDTSNHLYEIDFLLSKGDKINPIEVKSGNYRGHKSLDMFCDKYSSRTETNMWFIRRIINWRMASIICRYI